MQTLLLKCSEQDKYYMDISYNIKFAKLKLIDNKTHNKLITYGQPMKNQNLSM